MELALLSLLLVVVWLLVMRAITRERREYGKFKRLRSTQARQKVYRKWLIEGFLMFAGLTGVILLASHPYIEPTLADAREWAPVAWLVERLSGGFGAGVAIAASVIFLVALLLPVFVLRGQQDEIPAVGDIRALLPRTRGEVWYGAALSINAGVFEELLFRLAMPALLFGIIGNGALAFGLAAVLFGVLHLYQGTSGVLLSTLVGVLLTLIYLLTGSILLVIVLHALIDLRSLVLIPVVVMGVGRPGSVTAAPAKLDG